jgi:hypothetical protein
MHNLNTSSVAEEEEHATTPAASTPQQRRPRHSDVGQSATSPMGISSHENPVPPPNKQSKRKEKKSESTVSAPA